MRIPQLRIPQVRARGLLMWWGKIRFIYGYSVFYVGFIQLSLVALMAYDTTVRNWFWQYLHVHITLWQYLLALLLIVALGILVEYVISIPALIAISNEQMYKHESPIKTDFEDIKREQEAAKQRDIAAEKRYKAIEAKLDALLKREGYMVTTDSPHEDNG